MGGIFSKLFWGKKKKAHEKKEHEEEGAIGKTLLARPVDDSKAEIVINEDGTSEPNFLRDDSMARKMETKKEVDPIQNTTNINDGEKKKDEQNDRKTYTKKRKHDTSLSDTTSSSESDYDDYKGKGNKKKRRDKVTVVKSLNIKGGVHHYHGDITINNKTVINRNSPASQKTGTSSLFTCEHDKKSAAEFRKEIFRQQPGRNSDIGGYFIDLNRISLAEDAIERLAIDERLESVGIVVGPCGNPTFTCFRVGSKYVMTARHCIRILKTEWQDCLHEITEKKFIVDFKFLSCNEDRQSNMFYFKGVNKDSVPFVDKSTDCIILELEEVSGRPLPPPFKHFGLLNLNKKITMIHHAFGQTKKFEDAIQIADLSALETKQDLITLLELSERFLNANGMDPNQVGCEKEPYDYVLNHKRVLFHCQCNKGASGAPGLQVLSDKTVVVVTMLLRGYPDWYYLEKCGHIKDQWNKKYTVEQGSNMICVMNAIFNKNPLLFHDMFRLPLSRSVEPVPL